MEEIGKYRNELKYSIGYADYLALRSHLRPIMKADSHADANGQYQIRSIYFDNVNDKALREKVDGVAKREKFRIRYYNDDFSYITLEKKMKLNNLCKKLDAPLTEQECRTLLAGDMTWMFTHSSPLVQELYTKMRNTLLKPRVLVSYVREPYVYAPGNVRVTFDRNIRTTLWHNEFLEPKVRDICTEESPGQIILEVKFDDFLPDIIGALIQTDGTRRQAFSKYGACRKFG